MNVHPTPVILLNWLFNRSWQAALLVLLVLAAQRIFRRQLTNRWRFALWWIVILRLALPSGPESVVSLFNFARLPSGFTATQPAAPVENAPITKINPGVRPTPATTSAAIHPASEQPRRPIANITVEPRFSAETHVTAANDVGNISSRPQPSGGFGKWLAPVLAGVWLAGMVVFAGTVAFQFLTFRRQLSRASAVSDFSLLELLDECRGEFRLTRRIELMETDVVTSPALYGLMRPRLLLPRGLVVKFTARELRYVFLHELAHVKRRDLWLNWLVTALQIIHWFNPVVWLGFARLRADRELACDEMALVRLGETAGTSYGETIIRLLEGMSLPRAVPGLIGILEDKKQMRRRILMIAKFRKPGAWSALAAILVGVVGVAALTDAQTGGPAARPVTRSPAAIQSSAVTDEANAAARPDLNGTVHTKDGAPLTATIFIATAGPKTGTSTFCPSCYADCAKQAKADAKGSFKIESLDPQLIFRILVVAKGYKPKFVEKIDPAKGPVNAELEPMERSDTQTENILRGRVLNGKGEPVEGAAVEAHGITTKDGGSLWGTIGGVDPLAVTDAHGEFVITGTREFAKMDVKVQARTFADKMFTMLPAGRMNDLVMTDGATITGRVTANGKPVAGVAVGISGVDRTAGNYLGNFSVGTDAGGHFMFVNIPPEADFYIYGIMSTMDQLGAIPIQTIRTGKDDETTDAGDLMIGPGHRFAGRVALSDGSPIPANTRLLLSREQAWDSRQITLDPDGHFEATGISSGTVTVSVRVGGYRMSGRNASLDMLNPRMVGRVDRDITNLVLLLEKGSDLPRDYNVGTTPESEWPQNLPFRGAEGGADHSRDWSISGRVLDRETGQPIPNFRITTGETDQLDQMNWDTVHGVDGKDGVYQVYIGKRIPQPLLEAEADGYLPSSTRLGLNDATNVNFMLKKGSGPTGMVMLPDGTPADGATVALILDGFNQAILDAHGELSTYWNRSNVQKTDASGYFGFKPKLGVKSIAASSSNGFVLVDIESLAANPLIRLEPFGRISGTLKRASGPGTNEDLDLSFAGLPGINLNQHALTDARGQFKFDHVPAGHLQITYRDYMTSVNKMRSWQSKPLKEIDLQPGQNLEINIEATDLPPPAQSQFTMNQSPGPKRVPSVQINGVVIAPDGKPAADAQVALQMERKYLMLGRATFDNGGGPSEDWLVTTGPDGSFSLPMYDPAQSVIALNDEGYARVSLEQLKASPQIRLQKWGRIEGVLRSGHHPAANEMVTLSGPVRRTPGPNTSKTGQQPQQKDATNSDETTLPPLMYDYLVFQTMTDEQGRFVFTYVPPGPQTVNRSIPFGEHARSTHSVGTVEVKPGETAHGTFGGNGRTVIGRIKFADGEAPDFSKASVSISTPTSKLMEKERRLKTDEERQAFYASGEITAAMKDHRTFPAVTQPDGTFRSDDVQPGNYEIAFQVQLGRLDPNVHEFVIFSSAQEFTVAAARDQNDDSSVDLGTIDMKKFTIPIPGTRAAR
jgi:beta-lactamase regulating signal transducer with metallopeptidase domain/uncharacterized GH25 family protein